MTAVIKTLRYRVKDSTSGKRLKVAADAVTTCWNHCNAMQCHALKHNQRWVNPRMLQASTKGAGKELGIPSQTVQAVCERYFERRYFRRKPKLRWRGRKSPGWVPFKNQTIKIEGASVVFNGHRIRLWLHREIVGRILSGTFSQDSRGRWYCNLVVECEAKPHKVTESVGIDLGLKVLATLSTGERVENPRIFYAAEQRIAASQRANKNRLMRARRAKAKNTRRDFLHKESTKIADRFGCIMVGDVSASWQRSINGKAVTDASWGMLRRLLRYKAIARGAVYMDVPEAYTTQVCSSCGVMPEGRPKGIADLRIRQWECVGCGASHDRDVNAAINIARAGLRTLAEGAL